MKKLTLLIIFTFASLNLYGRPLMWDNDYISKEIDADAAGMDVCGQNQSNITNLKSEPSTYINNTVSVISGDYTESFTDCVASGPEPLVVSRVYSSGERANGSLCYGWHMGHYGLINRWKEHDKAAGRGYKATFIGTGGSRLTYMEQDEQQYQLEKKCIEKGMTNTASGMLSARTNPANDKLHSDKDRTYFTRINGAGAVSIFERLGHSPHFYLTSEEKPCGLTQHYSYDSKKRISTVSSNNPQGIKLAQVDYEVLSKRSVRIRPNGVLKAEYFFEKWGSDYQLQLVKLPNNQYHSYEYKYLGKKEIPALTRKNLPEGRSLEIEYFKKGDNAVPFGSVYVHDEKNPVLHRVKALKAPVGHDSSLQYIYKFNYNVKTNIINQWKADERIELVGGDTSVYDVYNRLTKYHYNEAQRLTLLEKYTGDGPNYQLYSFEKLFWDGPRLTNRIFHTREGWAQFCQQYDYDSRGNVLRETLWGNLSGYNDKQIAYPPNGYPEYNGCEFEFELYTYSDDGLNLMTSHTEGKTSHTTYEYVEGTDRLAKKLEGPIGKIQRREFYQYDANGTLVRRVCDDGDSSDENCLQNVTERHITIITPTTTLPIGMPAITEERYVDLKTGEECSLQKIVHTFTMDGLPATKEVYDANGAFVHSERWEYDAIGNILLYQDPLGNVVSKQYDANSNLVHEQGPRLDFHREYTYDFSNRLIKSETVCNNGLRLADRYFYDLYSNKVATEDIYGNRVESRYDEFGRCTKTIAPVIYDENGVAVSAEKTTIFGEMSFPHVEIDARGFSTHRRFTIKGKPFDVLYPDGSHESLAYNVDGTVQKHRHANGSYTIYEYDYQKRETKNETYSKDDVLLDAIYKEYSGFRLLKETTLGGISTVYKYNYAGQLIEVTKGDSRTTYAYDAMGRKVATKVYYSHGKNDYIAYIEVLDCLGRVIESREEGGDGQVLKRTEYGYDLCGNQNQVINHVEGGLAIISKVFDPMGQEISCTDPSGNTTTTIYDYAYTNEHGQGVAKKTVIDPLGNQIECIANARGELSKVQKFNIGGELLHQTLCFYDANGNKVRQQELTLSKYATERKTVTLWQYDSCNRVIGMTEAAGDAEQKQTAFVYNQYGQKELVVKPDGVHLRHSYDDLGRLLAIQSSDATVDMEYHYDIHGNAIQVDDRVNSFSTLRTYDDNNRLVKEQLGNGAALAYTYDSTGRPLSVMLPDSSGVKYEYQASHLHKVNRIDKKGKVAHQHIYQKYGAGGVLLAERYVGNVGDGIYTYDLMGRLKTFKAKLLQEEVRDYDEVGNMLARSLKDPVSTANCNYTYDDLYQLEEETGVASNSYGYDSLNNRVVKNGDDQQLNNLNQVLSDGPNEYVYDANGNLVEKKGSGEGVHYAYDAFDRLTTVTKNDSQYRYTYDELNRRLTKAFLKRGPGGAWLEQNRVKYIYHGQNEVGILDVKNVLQQYRLLGTGKGAEIGATVLVEVNGKAYVPLHEHGANISCLVDVGSGKAVQTYRYSAFGEEQLYDGSGRKVEYALSPWRFSSKRVDEETGFVYFGRRYYEPSMGRWVSADPLGYDAGPNLYAYVLNNPMTHYDLYGLYGVGANAGSGGGTYYIRPMSWMLNAGMFLVQQGVRAAGKAIEQVGFHLIPLPEAQDAVRAIGTFMEQGNLSDFQTWRDMHSVYCNLGLEEKDPDQRIVLQNGILTSFEEARAMAQEVSNRIGGYNVHFCYNSSHGFVADILECVAQKLDIGTRSVDHFTKTCAMLSQDMGANGKLHVYAHSQGGLITSCARKSLFDNERARMVVTTFGSATQIGDGEYSSVENFVSPRDLIPFSDPIGMFKAYFASNSNTTILTTKCKTLEHGWMKGAYKKTFKTVLSEHHNRG